jgi:hypothetical protein
MLLTRQSYKGSSLGSRSPLRDFVPCLFLVWGMALLLRKSSAQARIDGLDPTIWDEDDYAIVDEIKVGRIYAQRIHGEIKWVWCLQTCPTPPPNRGIADTLEESERGL